MPPRHDGQPAAFSVTELLAELGPLDAHRLDEPGPLTQHRAGPGWQDLAGELGPQALGCLAQLSCA